MEKQPCLELRAFLIFCCVQGTMYEVEKDAPIARRFRAMKRSELESWCYHYAIVYQQFERKEKFGMALLQLLSREVLEIMRDLHFYASSNVEDMADKTWAFEAAIYAEMDRRDGRGELYKKLCTEIDLRKFYKYCLHQPQPGDEDVEYVDLPW